MPTYPRNSGLVSIGGRKDAQDKFEGTLMKNFNQNGKTSPLVKILSAFVIMGGLVSPSFAAAGSEGAAFLQIPVGAGPAAMGSAYTALATNAYAPTWNPAGLGFADAIGVSAQHLSYLDSIHYEYLSGIYPFGETRDSHIHSGLGFSAQYLGTGNIAHTDISDTGGFIDRGDSFSSHYGAYNLSYGQTLTDKLALGVTGKWINAAIEDVSANAFGGDIGAMYRMSEKINLAATIMNLGQKLKFLDDGDSLPTEFHLAGAFRPAAQYLLTAEGVVPKSGMASARVGGEWSPLQPLSLRVGYRTDTLKGLSPLAGFSTGLGINAWGQEFAYAWVPYGDLGNTQYFSILLKLGAREEEKRNLIQYQTIKKHRTVQRGGSESEPEYQQLMQLLSDDGTHVAQRRNAASSSADR